MSESNDLPSYESLRKSDASSVLNSMDMLRIRWEPFGTLQEAVVVADDVEAGSDSSESPYQQVTADGVSYHPVSQSPATEPLVSSITVKIQNLEDWAWDWEQKHEPHAEDCGDDDTVEWAEKIVDGEPIQILMRCCDEDRPKDAPQLVVRPTTQNFVTVHDYISQIHAWLQVLKSDILLAREESYGISPDVLPQIVDLYSLDRISFRDDADRLWDLRAEQARRRKDGTWPTKGPIHARAHPLP